MSTFHFNLRSIKTNMFKRFQFIDLIFMFRIMSKQREKMDSNHIIYKKTYNIHVEISRPTLINLSQKEHCL